jgi:hypothetical protein
MSEFLAPTPFIVSRVTDWVSREEIRLMLLEMRDIINLSKRKSAVASTSIPVHMPVMVRQIISIEDSPPPPMRGESQ